MKVYLRRLIFSLQHSTIIWKTQQTENLLYGELPYIILEVQIKGTVRVFLCDPPCKDCNVRFTTVPLKALSDIKYEIVIHFFFEVFLRK